MVVDRRSEKSAFDQSFTTFLEKQKTHLNNPDVQKIMIEAEEFAPLLDRVVDISLQEEKTTLYTLLSQIPGTDEEIDIHTTKVTALINYNPLLIYAKNEDGTTPLHFAAQARKLETVQALLEAGANPTVTTNSGGPPLYYARNHAIRSELRKAGA